MARPPSPQRGVTAASQGGQARLFVALWPGPSTREALSAWQRAQAWPAGTRLTRPADLHLTLHFIGAVPRCELARVGAGLAVDAPPVVHALRFERGETWRDGLVVLCPAPPWPQALLDLHGALGHALAALGLPVDDRPFRPHVTVARHARDIKPAPIEPPLRWQGRGHVLAESAGGYRVVRRYG